MKVLKYRQINSLGEWRVVNNRDLQRDENLRNLLSRGYAVTYAGYEYRLFSEPREYWLIAPEKSGKDYFSGRIYHSLSDAIVARDKYWPSREIIHVREVVK